MTFPTVPHIPIKKSQEVLDLYQEFGPKFGKILYSLYQDIKVGNDIDIEKQFVQLCQDYMSVKIRSPEEFYKTFPFTYQRNYLGERFEHAVCVSINDEVAHGQPGRHKIKHGDVISVDCGVGIPFGPKYKSQYVHFDAAFTTVIQEEDTWTLEPLKALRNITLANPSNTADIATIIHKTAHKKQLQQVVSLTGHGIGLQLHEAPVVHNAPGAFLSVDLFDGLCFCAEPIFTNNLTPDNSFITPVHLGNNGWMVLTTTGILASHFETVFGVIEGQIVDLVGVTTWDL